MTWSWWITIWLRHLIKDAMKRVWGRKRESSLISWAWGLLDKCRYRFAFFNRRGLCVDFNTCHLLLKNILFPNGLVLFSFSSSVLFSWLPHESVFISRQGWSGRRFSLNSEMKTRFLGTNQVCRCRVSSNINLSEHQLLVNCGVFNSRFAFLETPWSAIN